MIKGEGFGPHRVFAVVICLFWVDDRCATQGEASFENGDGHSISEYPTVMA
jgi:hypothetical protein